MRARTADFSLAGIEAEKGAPLPERLLSGNPEFRTWNVEDTGDGLYAGIWESTPGKWTISYDEWEYFHILEGHSIVMEDGGEPVHLKAGDRLIIRPGFRGTWEVVETTRKDYVIKV
jgi:hypothetical protein